MGSACVINVQKNVGWAGGGGWSRCGRPQTSGLLVLGVPSQLVHSQRKEQKDYN